MWIRRMNQCVRRDEAGQALVLGALTLLVLALSVMATAQLGYGISERIRVQDAADNAAYSTAAAVARSLNFISWVNRTIAAQYVAAMAVQGLLAAVDGLDAWMGMLSDTAQSLASLSCALKRAAQVCCSLCPIPAAAAASCALKLSLDEVQTSLESAVKALRKAEQSLRKLSDRLDPIAAAVVLAIVYLNRYGMVLAQIAMKESTHAVLLSTSAGKNFQTAIMEATGGPNLNSSRVGALYRATMGLVNGPRSYRSLFDEESERIPDGGTTADYDALNAQQRSERLMAAVANATRTGAADYPTHWETNGGVDLKRALPGGLGIVAGKIAGRIVGSTRLVRPMSAEAFTEEKASGRAKSGARGTAIASDRQNYIWTTGKDVASMTRGPALVSAEWVEAPIAFVNLLSGGGSKKIVGVQAAHAAGDRMHCRYDGRIEVDPGICPAYAWTKPIKCEQEDRHEFWGMTRYVNFKISETYPFGATDYLGLVNKAPKDAGLPVAVFGFGERRMSLGGWARSGGAEATFWGRRPGSNAPVLEGLNGWARAQAYYHRPGAWAEPPNLFNPFWRARLAPVRFMLDEVFGNLPAGEVKELASKALLH